MRWKKILIAAALAVVVLIAAAYVILLNLDINRYKPRITQLVLDATGRKLTIGGSIDIGLGIRPTLVVEDVGFENATWGLKPDLARVKRVEVQLALLPLIWGKFDFAHLVLVEPEVIVEFDSAGTSNFAFDTLSKEKRTSTLPPPPLIFSDILIEKGLFIYSDKQSDIKFSVRIDSLEGEIEGFNKPLHLDFKGAFDEIPLSLAGTVGPIWASIEPGYTLPADLKVTAGGATATIKGELRDPINFKDLAFEIAAHGSSVAEITRQAGLAGVPKLGAFNLTANLNDSAGNLAVEKLDVRIGNQELVAIALTGDVRNVLALQGANLTFTAQGQDSANLTQIGLPELPVRGAFQIKTQISDPEANVFTASDLSVVLGENEVDGQLNLNLAEKVPLLTARLTSQKFKFGPFNLNLDITGPVEKPAVKKIDLKLGNSDLAEIRLNGVVDDLMKLQGVDINFQASSKDLAHLEKLTGQPLPVRGAFSAAGKVLIPVHKKLQIPDLKISAGKNKIAGSLNLDLSGDRPKLKAQLSSPKLDLPSVLLPKLAKQGWARGLGQVRPVKLDLTLDGFAQEITVKKIDLQAGTLKSAQLRLTGSVENLQARRGMDLKVSLRGNEVAKLKEIIAQPYIFAPVPGQGAYALSGHVTNSAAGVFKVEKLKIMFADTELTGQLGINLTGRSPAYEIKISGPKFNLKPFPIPKEAAYAHLNKIDNLGPLKLHSKVIAGDAGLFLQHLNLQAGSEQLVAADVKGSIKNLKKQNGIDLNFNIRGNEVANLAKITGQPLPLKGAYAISGRLTDPKQKNYKFSALALKLGKNNITGTLDLNLSGKQLRLATDLAAPKFTLQPVTVPAFEPLTRIENLGPFRLTANIAGTGKKFSLNNLDFNLGSQSLIEVNLKGTIQDLLAAREVKLGFAFQGENLSSITKLGGPSLPFQGAFNISGEFSDPDPKIYKIPSLDAVWGDNDIKGWIVLDLSNDQPLLSAELSSQKLDLRPVVEKSEKNRSTKAPAPKPSAGKDRYFSDEPFDFKPLNKIDADIKLRNDHVLLPALALKDARAHILLKSGNLQVKPFSFGVGGGKADVQFDLRSQDTPPRLEFAKIVDRLDLGPMLDELGYPKTVEGILDSKIQLSGQGNSMAELMAGLNGDIRMTMRDGRAASKYLDLIQKYLGSGALRLLNPFEAKTEFTPINCFVNKIEINDGRAEVQLLLDTDQTSILGAGDVNLKTEGLNLGIKPTPKKTHRLSAVSFSFKELSQPFRLGGTLTHPSLVIDPGRTALTLGKFAGALALGPAGLTAFFADVSLGKKDPCPVAIEAASQETQPSDSQKDAGGKKEEKPRGIFKRLFGK
jgi:uncharacterized protein involved in outer membrane biogenesis